MNAALSLLSVGVRELRKSISTWILHCHILARYPAYPNRWLCGDFSAVDIGDSVSIGYFSEIAVCQSTPFSKIAGRFVTAANVCLLPGINIRESFIIGAGSVVTKDVGKNEVWAGSPAVKIRTLEFKREG